MNIPFLSLKKQNQAYLTTYTAVFEEFLDRGYYMLHQNVDLFEKAFAEFCEVPFCIGVANGLDALELIFESLSLPEGAEVIVPANTYFASILSIINTGLKPVLVEPNPENFLLDPEKVRAAISADTRAILAVNLYGKMCDYTALKAIKEEFNLYLVTDAAQSHDALYQGSRDCLGADAIAYSFYPTKNLGALSDAGAVVTANEALANKIKSLRNYGSEIRYSFKYLGRNSRLSELQAGFLTQKLKDLPQETNTRRSIAKRYLSEITHPELLLPPSDSVEQDAWHLFVIRYQDRAKLQAYLKGKGIGTDIHYPVPPHQQEALSDYRHLNLPTTEEMHRTVLSIPLNGSLSEDEVSYIINSLNQF
jgi:dTDP-4-amino-4,6-dideoxygalactose transaminase